MRVHKYNIIIPSNLKPKPEFFEIITAELMAEYLQDDIKFILRGHTTTPDILAMKLNQVWEIKNIRGNNKNTIARNLKWIYRQSENVIITLFRSKMTAREAVSQIRRKISSATKIKRIVLITKTKKIIVIK